MSRRFVSIAAMMSFTAFAAEVGTTSTECRKNGPDPSGWSSCRDCISQGGTSLECLADSEPVDQKCNVEVTEDGILCNLAPAACEGRTRVWNDDNCGADGGALITITDNCDDHH